MTCNRYEYQLSLHLDGRLSSARREALMAHLAGCDSCQSLWAELQKAQELAFSLPRVAVSHGFRESLFDRIRSGEGTPDAVFKEPVPKLVKLRYLATGAAAAAVILIGLNLYGARPASQEDSFAVPPLANGTLTRAEPLSEEFRPFTASYVAEAGANSVTRTIDDLQYRTAELSQQVDRMPPNQLMREDQQLITLLQNLRGSVSLMRTMQDQKIIYLPTRFSAELRFTEDSLRQFESAESAVEFRFALKQIDRVKVEHMRDPFQVLCCQNPDEFFALYSSMVERNPDIGRVFRVVASQDPRHMGPAPQGNRLFQLQLRIRRQGSVGAADMLPGGETQDVEIRVEKKRLLKGK